MTASKPRRMTDDGELHELADYIEPAPERVFCTQCGTSNPADSRYCRSCGHSLTEGEDAPAALPVLQKPKRAEMQAAQQTQIALQRMGFGAVIFEIAKLLLMGTLVYMTAQISIVISLAVLLVWLMTEMARHGAFNNNK